MLLLIARGDAQSTADLLSPEVLLLTTVFHFLQCLLQRL
jgi:hypothetical protein